jgi:hypothetical protein
MPPKDLVNDCLDVYVTLKDDYCDDDFGYCVEVTTLQFLSTLMKKSESEFVEPGFPYIIVSKLTDEIIRDAIQAFIDKEDDSFWLKLYHTTVILTIEDINEILYRKKQERIKLDVEVDAEIEGESGTNQ